MDDCVTLYVDGSGHPDWRPPHGKGDSGWYTAGGIILTPRQDLAVREGIERVLNRYVPDEARRARPPGEYELHLAVMLSNSGLYRKISAGVVGEMISGVYRLLVRVNPTFLAASVNKTSPTAAQKESQLMPKELAERSLVHEFSAYLSQHDKIGHIIYDYDKPKPMDRMQEFFWRYRKEGSGAYRLGDVGRFENILNNIIGCRSHYSPGLQLADFVAHSVWKRREKDVDQYYSRLSPYWWKGDLLV